MIIVTTGGIHSALQLKELGHSVDVVLRENYESVLACQEMKESLDRMDSGAVFMFIGHEKEGKELLATNEPRFARALEKELHNVTLPGEGENAALLQQLYQQYLGALATIRNPAMAQKLKHDAYFIELLPLFYRIKDTADDILRMNQDHMVTMDQKARQQASTAQRRVYIMLVVAIFLAAAFMYLTGEWILRPITRLTRSAEEIRRGNLDLVVQSSSRDEIGQLSEAFNTMAAS
ncbi:MAG TPA: HAMP domain-containing protein, partial [Candidatus Deferrimicrobiaceae bacterium]|nr:HAMP domain-containing protein [Candidatus Deferrimicrobiaceae bacterium]